MRYCDEGRGRDHFARSAWIDRRPRARGHQHQRAGPLERGDAGPALLGTTLIVADANGLVTKVRYDGLGRKTPEQYPDGNGTRWIYQACGGAMACPGVWNANVDSDAGTKDGPHTRTYYEVLERVEREGWDGEGTARLIYEDTAYNGWMDKSVRSPPELAGTPPLGGRKAAGGG